MYGWLSRWALTAILLGLAVFWAVVALAVLAVLRWLRDPDPGDVEDVPWHDYPVQP